jgi:hypothetical protein
MTRNVMRANGAARSRRSASLVLAILALIVVRLGSPSRGVREAARMPHPAMRRGAAGSGGRWDPVAGAGRDLLVS